MSESKKRLKLAVLADELTLGSPAQQLVDRFLIGFPTAGGFRETRFGEVSIHAPEGACGEEIARRSADHVLAGATDAAEAVARADCVLVIPRGAGNAPMEDRRLVDALRSSPGGARLFVHGVLASDAAGAQRAADFAALRKIQILAGGSLPVTWRLPPIDVPHGDPLSHALVVAVGDPGEAELQGADALTALVARRYGGESGVDAVRAFMGEAVWKAHEAGEWWPQDLLAAALSRSDTPQGDALVDGRTQDLLALGLVQRLARDPVAYVIEHSSGLRSTVLVLNGVVADVNFAVETGRGGRISAQLYRPPAPASHQWSALAEVIDGFFASGIAPWPVERSILTAGLLDAFRKARAAPGERILTPELAIAYTVPPGSMFARG